MPFQGTPGSPAVGAMMLSHGGDRIAFSAGPPTAPDVYVASLDAPQPLRLTDAAGDYKKDGTYYFRHMWPKFSPDDKTVLFQTLSGGASLTHPNNSVSVVSAAGGAIQRLGEGYSERAYWSADGSRVCSYTQRQNRVVYEVASGRAFVAPTDSALRDPERACRIIAAAASLDTCEEPRAVDDLTDDRLYHGGGERPARHWLTPDIVLTTYEWRQGGRPGYRIQLARALAGTD